jgi:hypothetical protein
MSYDKLKATREYKAYRRTVDPAFVEAEKASRKRYVKGLNEFNRWRGRLRPSTISNLNSLSKRKSSQVSKMVKCTPVASRMSVVFDRL